MKPNIVLLLSDQHRADALGSYGAPVNNTPVLDSLAAEGSRFTRAYTPCALCTPARASLLTGLYPHNHGQLANMHNFNGVFDTQVLNKKAYPEYASSAGYRVGYAGKWHLPNEGNMGHWHIDDWHHDYHAFLREHGYGDYEIGRDDVQRLEWGGNASFCGKTTLPTELHHDSWVSSNVIEMMNSFYKEDKPFMICGAFFGPHFPYAIPEEYLSLYSPSDVPQWGNFQETFQGKPIIQQKELLRWNSSHLTWPDWQRIISAYWGYCTFIDHQIGRVVDELKKLGLYDNTIIIYTSDHGDMLGSHRLFNKGFNMYEETNRVPLIVRMPGATGSSEVCDEFVNLVDIMPTIVDMAGAKVTLDVDGRSLVPLLNGAIPDEWPDDVYGEFNGYEPTLTSIRMVRTKKWKYIYNPTSIDELYDVESDPYELVNLANQLGFKHVLRRMKQRLVQRLKDTGDSIIGTTSWQSNSYDLFVSEREV